MLRLGIAALCFASAAGATDLCASPPGTSSEVLVTKTCAALRAVNQKDSEALRSLMADDFALTTVSGNYYVAARDEMVKRWTEPDAKGTTSRSTLTALSRVFMTEELGFVSGVIEDRMQKATVVDCSTHTFTDIWVKRQGSWQWLQSHESGLRTPACKP